MVAQSNTPIEAPEISPKSGSDGDTFSSNDVDMKLTDVQALNRSGSESGNDNLHNVEFGDGQVDDNGIKRVEPRELQFPAADPNLDRVAESNEKGTESAEAKNNFSRAVENDDGSRVEFIKVNGKEVVSTIVHPSGDKTVYSGHDADGNPTKVVDTNKDGIQTAYAERTGKNVWTMSNKAIRNGAAFKAAGELTVDENGDHTFKDAVNGSVFVRKADGTMTFTDHQGANEVKGPDDKLREPADTSKPIDGADETPDKAEEKPEGGSEVVRSVENPDGSRIEFTKGPNGKEVVSTVVRPSGEKTVYGGHDADGNPTNVKEFDKSGKQIGESSYDGNVWNTRHDAINNGMPFRQVGELTVGEDGTHSFKDSMAGTTFNRTSDGRISISDASGNSKLIKNKDKIERSPEPTDANGDIPKENVRMVENADGSKIEMTKLPNGQEVVTEVHYPTGDFVRFSGHDDSGQPTRAEEYNQKGVRTGHSQREGEQWTVTSQKHNDGKPYKLPGTFEVTSDGKQIFTHPQDGRKLVRLPNGKTQQIVPEETE